ncbi:MAG: PilZ domain-containing protein [Ilumatobacteraceae bacterium]
MAVGATAARRVRRRLLTLVVVLDVAVVAAACRLATAGAGGGAGVGRGHTSTSTTDRVLGVTALTLAGVTAVSGLLAAARVVRRNHSVRAERRLPASVVARIGPHRGQVLDLAASGFRAEFAAPAELLSELPVRLDVRGLAPISVRAQVVRVEPRGDRWTIGLRLVTVGATDHDEYLALWLSQMVGAAEQRPRRLHDPVVGRWPVTSGGAPVVRVLSAAAMLLLGVAVLPAATAGASRADRASRPAATSDSATSDPATTDPRHPTQRRPTPRRPTTSARRSNPGTNPRSNPGTNPTTRCSRPVADLPTTRRRGHRRCARRPPVPGSPW